MPRALFIQTGPLPIFKNKNKIFYIKNKKFYYQLLKIQFSTIRNVILALDSAIDAQWLGDYHVEPKNSFIWFLNC